MPAFFILAFSTIEMFKKVCILQISSQISLISMNSARIFLGFSGRNNDIKSRNFSNSIDFQHEHAWYFFSFDWVFNLTFFRAVPPFMYIYRQRPSWACGVVMHLSRTRRRRLWKSNIILQAIAHETKLLVSAETSKWGLPRKKCIFKISCIVVEVPGPELDKIYVWIPCFAQRLPFRFHLV